MPKKSALGYVISSDESSNDLSVVELLYKDEETKPIELRSYSPQAFLEVVRSMRANSNALGSATTKV